MKKLYVLPLLLLLSACMNTSVEEYDDTQDLEFLEQFAAQEGVVVTDSGLMYRVIEEGEGDAPGADNYVFVRYTGNSVDNQVRFDTEGNPDIILPSSFQQFLGLAEGVQLMSPGSVYEFAMPTELAQGDGRAYEFEVEMDSFLMDPDEFLAQNAEEEDIIVTDSGLQYRVIEEGDGEAPNEDSVVIVNYRGTYTNGFVFDEGDDAEFPIQGVIEGFTEALLLMETGAKYEIFVPTNLGYGEEGTQGIIPGAVLIFELELLEVI
ncbi:MAG: FKBP-type peptidyl-prolyl cis-trans isomerase [Balneolaceae bacterium]|nr:FKBP-type peptidyl-prolyl cis-trans isomerase [Balneolaceae bacterium]MCH8548465.1 FKBP-type peptidyl-prolyl cis-trans isomerase [Balneolaceae bacterium]